MQTVSVVYGQCNWQHILFKQYATKAAINTNSLSNIKTKGSEIIALIPAT